LRATSGLEDHVSHPQRTGDAIAAETAQKARGIGPALREAMLEASALRVYRDNLSNVHPLEREAERKLAKRWIKGDEAAGVKLVEACLPFVISIALEYRRWGVPLEDVIQQGNIGLLKAAKKFDPDMGCRLATYAAYWIRAEIREYVVRAYRIVRLGTTKAERRALRAYRTTKESDPDRLAAVSGLSRERVEQLLPLLAARETSLDANVNDLPPAVERLASNDSSPEDDAGAKESRARAKDAVAVALEGLTDRERLIVRERMMSDEPTTLKALGDILGVSKERVRQLEERARGKLRSELEALREDAIALGVA
jgi:RNA polymerase sigma-32 factor